MNRTNLFRLIALLVLLLLFIPGCTEPVEDPGISKDNTIEDTTENTTESTTENTIETLTSTTLGGKVPDMTFTTPAGEEIRLYELLQEKKLVVLNFWFANCGWCRREFPVMEVSYQRFREDVEILALNPYDSQEVIAAFQKENSLSFPMVSCSEDLASAFGVDGYPTSVCIDREGTISLIHAGAITDSTVFDELFETYTAEDYSSRVYYRISELLT